MVWNKIELKLIMVMYGSTYGLMEAKIIIYVDIKARATTNITIFINSEEKRVTVDSTDEKEFKKLWIDCNTALKTRDANKYQECSNKLAKLYQHHKPNSKYTFVWLD